MFGSLLSGARDGCNIQAGMPLFPSFALTGVALLQVYLMLSVVHAGDEECLGNSNDSLVMYVAGQQAIYCYDCTADSDKHYCGDPFNSTHPDLIKVPCRDYCVKWSRTTLSGRTYYLRTCSDRLQIGMRKAVVCIEESRPSKGQLCFCDKDKCNAAETPHTKHVTAAILFLALLISYFVSNVRFR